MTNNNITAIVLAGGQGSRMDHQDKAWVDFEGRPLIHHVIEKIEPWVDQIVISRNRPNPAPLKYACYPDELPGFQGPLAGIAACAEQVVTDAVLVVPCDTPNLPGSLISTLASQLSDRDLAVAEQGGRMQSLVFLTKTEVLKTIRLYLESGGRSVMGWIETMNFVIVPFDDCPQAFENINKTSQLR
ncbi:MAG: molybdenum cofactor guanylyltransferase [Gammaproteobacteria bacterium]|jgi:molybdenum cofactor guanylyltransferase|nr:molybdenum cofactor guanylyltransferase [Gammaproteobacteria bacterium]